MHSVGALYSSSERDCPSLPFCHRGGSRGASMALEQRWCEHLRRTLHSVALRNAVPLHIPTSSPHATASRAHNPLRALSLSYGDGYDVRCDPSDGAGAGVTHGTREVRRPRSRRWERDRPARVGLVRVSACRWCYGRR